MDQRLRGFEPVVSALQKWSPGIPKPLLCAIRQQNRDTVDDRITSSTSLTHQALGLEFQLLTADRARDPLQILYRPGVRVHGSILANRASNKAARYHN